jgi:hypothetical protein
VILKPTQFVKNSFQIFLLYEIILPSYLLVMVLL